MKNKILAVSHLLVLSAIIYWSYYSNTGAVNNNTMATVSDKFDSLFTPAGYAFAIWGIIYIGLIGLGINMISKAFRNISNDNFIEKAAPTLILSYIGNALWVWFWLNEQAGISVIIMLFILTMLIITIVRLNMQLWDAPLKYIALVWWPIDIYFGWISVATIANISAYLNSIHWTGGLSEITWTIIMIFIATLLALYMTYSRNMREYTGVFIWAFIAIAVKHYGQISSITWCAIIGAVIMGIGSGIHAYKNRATNPFTRKNQPSIKESKA